MKKILFIIVGFSLVFFLAWLGEPVYSWAGPSISISPEDYDAGDLARAPDMIQKVFQVSNNGDSLLSINKIKYT
jgi:hypothetical protein